MNRDEAKYLLRAYPVGGQGSDDPQFREALEMAGRDPVLAEWFAREQALDGRLSERFRAFPVPPDLKAQLLAARKVIRHRAGWRRPAWAAAAAGIMLAAALGAGLLRQAGRSPFVDFRSYVADTTAKLDHLDLLSSNVTEVRKWLQNKGAPGDFIFPAGLSGKPSIGCRVFGWRGQNVSLVCFRIEGGHEVHLFVVDRHRLREAPGAAPPTFAVAGGIATASWSHDRRVYVLATDGSEEDLRRLL
jgi:hypothetical protein